MKMVSAGIDGEVFHCPFSGEVVIKNAEIRQTPYLAGVFFPMEGQISDVSPHLMEELLALLREDTQPEDNLISELFAKLEQLKESLIGKRDRTGDLIKLQKVQEMTQACFPTNYAGQEKAPAQLIKMMEGGYEFMPPTVFHHLKNRISDRYVCYDLNDGQNSLYLIFDTQTLAEGVQS